MPPEFLKIIDADSLLNLHYKISTSPHLLMKSTSDVYSYEVLEKKIDLQLKESTYQIDHTHQLVLPKSKSWRGENGNGDRENCEAIFNALPGLTATAATDERLWVTLCFNQFCDYTNARWPINSSKDPEIRDKELSSALFEHRFAGTARARWRNNSISRLWWMAYYANSFSELSPDTVLDILCLDSDLVSTFLGRPWTSNNRAVAGCLLKELHSEYFVPNSPDFSREKFRKTLKELDLRAGKYLLAALGEKAIEDLVKSVFSSHHGK